MITIQVPVALDKISQVLHPGLSKKQHQANNDFFAKVWEMTNWGGYYCYPAIGKVFQKTQEGFVQL
jgi:hypothetical protein